MTARHRHLDYDADVPVEARGPAAIDDVLDRGDLSSWAALAAAVRSDPFGPLADTILRLCEAHPMYGTSALWREWIARLRRRERPVLRQLRERRGLTQQDVAEQLGISQSDVSKLERRADLRLSTLRGYLEAIGCRLVIRASCEDGETLIEG